MKKMSKILSLVMALVMLLCLCACGSGGSVSRSGGESIFQTPVPETFETRIQRADEQMTAVKSIRMDMSMDMQMNIKIMGQSMDMNIIADYGIETERDPLKMSMNMDMDLAAMGEHQNQKALFYIEQDGGQYVVYSSMDGGATWQKQTTDTPEELQQQQNAEEEMKLFMACADSFQESGKQTINGSSAIVYKGVLDGEFVKQAVESSGSLDSVSALLGGTVPEDLFNDLGTITVTVAFDEQSGYLVYYEMDMAEVMGNLMQRLMKSVMESYGAGEMEIETDVSVTKISVTMSKFDQVSVSIPDAAKAA